MAARVDPLVNLLPSDRFEYSRVGRFLKWALSTGRHVLMLTELVVIIAFLSRFWFDRSLENLREVRIQKEAIVDSYDQVLQGFLTMQSQLVNVRRILRTQFHPAERLSSIQLLTPRDVRYTNIETSTESATLKGFVPSAPSFSTLLSRLQADPTFSEVLVRSLQLSRDHAPGVDFEVDVSFASESVL